MAKYRYLKDLSSFKAYMVSSKVPNYVIRYCESLDIQKWEWFYSQMLKSMDYIADVDRLFYVLKWVLKNNFNDLLYEIYFQDYFDPEMYPGLMFKNEHYETLRIRYHDRLTKDMEGMV